MSLNDLSNEIITKLFHMANKSNTRRSLNKTFRQMLTEQPVTIKINLQKLLSENCLETSDERPLKEVLSAFSKINLELDGLDAKNPQAHVFVHKILQIIDKQEHLKILSLKTKYSITQPQTLSFLKDIQRLDFSYMNWSDKMLPYCSNLETLNMTHCNLDDNNLHLLCTEVLDKMPKIKNLILDKNFYLENPNPRLPISLRSLSMKHCEANLSGLSNLFFFVLWFFTFNYRRLTDLITEMYNQGTDLTKINISENDIQAKKLNDFLKENTTVTELNIKDCKIKIELLAEGISNNDTLTALDISSNSLQDSTTMDDILRKNSSIRILSMPLCSLSSLHENSTITALNLRLQHTGMSTTLFACCSFCRQFLNLCAAGQQIPFFPIISQNTTLKILKLKKNIFLQNKCQFLSQNKTLQIINLSKSRFDTLTNIVAMLHNNANLVSLNLSDCSLDIGKLCDSLTQHKGIREIDMSYNFLKDTDFSLFESLLSKNKSLTTLKMKETNYRIKLQNQTKSKLLNVIAEKDSFKEKLESKLFNVMAENKTLRNYYIGFYSICSDGRILTTQFKKWRETKIAAFPKIH